MLTNEINDGIYPSDSQREIPNFNVDKTYKYYIEHYQLSEGKRECTDYSIPAEGKINRNLQNYCFQLISGVAK